MILTVIRWIIAAPLGILFAAIAAANFWCWFIQKTGPGEPHTSVVPIVGGILGAFAMLILPFGSLSQRLWFVWIPPLVDVGCVWYTVGVSIYLMKEAKETRQES
jgi:hypothetical protein